MENNFMQTQRNYKDVETGIFYSLFTHTINHTYKLIITKENNLNNLSTEINKFYISAHTQQDIKINNKKIIHLNIGDFYNLKEGEQVTHRKFCGFNKFTKIK